MPNERNLVFEEAVDVLEDAEQGGLTLSDESHDEWIEARRVVFGDDDEVVQNYEIVRDCGGTVHRPSLRELLEQIVATLALQAHAVAEPHPKLEPSLFVGIKEAARLLGIKPAALYARVARGNVPGVIRTGAKTEFHRAKLEAGLARRAR